MLVSVFRTIKFDGNVWVSYKVTTAEEEKEGYALATTGGDSCDVFFFFQRHLTVFLFPHSFSLFFF